MFREVMDMTRWSSWCNAFSVALGDDASEIQEGASITITSRWRDGSTDSSPEQICGLEPDTYIAWRYTGMPRWMLTAIHHVTLKDTVDGVEVESWEDFSGPVVVFLHLLGKIPLVQAAFSEFLKDLQTHLDSQVPPVSMTAAVRSLTEARASIGVKATQVCPSRERGKCLELTAWLAHLRSG